jgi:hypothetical protein
MNIPNLNSVIETFIKIPYSKNVPDEKNWQDYIKLLRSKVAPLVHSVMEKDTITWYAFLVHNRESGVPTTKRDKGRYVHLRMALADGIIEKKFIRSLPAYCVMTRKMAVPDLQSLDTIDVSSLANANVQYGWRILGESSEWALKVLENHGPKKPIPIQNIAQFLHYLGNQLYVRVADIPMP